LELAVAGWCLISGSPGFFAAAVYVVFPSNDALLPTIGMLLKFASTPVLTQMLKDDVHNE